MKSMLSLKFIYFLSIILGLNINHSLANHVSTEIPLFTNEYGNNIMVFMLAPVTPHSATFEDASVIPGIESLVASITPKTPSFADFSDTAPEMLIDVKAMAPVIPHYADFEEVHDRPAEIHPAHLSPATPVDADFSDSI